MVFPVITYSSILIVQEDKSVPLDYLPNNSHTHMRAPTPHFFNLLNSLPTMVNTQKSIRIRICPYTWHTVITTVSLGGNAHLLEILRKTLIAWNCQHKSTYCLRENIHQQSFVLGGTGLERIMK